MDKPSPESLRDSQQKSKAAGLTHAVNEWQVYFAEMNAYLALQVKARQDMVADYQQREKK